MADNLMLSVPENFDLDVFGERLSGVYRAKGYTVNVARINNGIRVRFEKDLGGINTLLGLGTGITALCMVQGGNLSVSFTDAEWTSKIIGGVVGWFLCLIPFITAIIGLCRQLELPKDINNDVMMLANS